jgi:recombination protein RecR
LPKSFEELVQNLTILPGVGEKTAERYAFTMLDLEEEKLSDFSNTVLNLKKNITTCPKCGCLTDTNKCTICDDDSRSKDVICVVENQKNVFIFERKCT